MTEPLVSVFVCTYNSSKTILETLESIKMQTYQNIELIVSDDDSKDETVSICKNWVFENKNRFNRTQVITHYPNTGTSGNANRAVSACKGEWVKGVAGDDNLLPNCIVDFVNYINSNPNAKIVFSRVVGFGNLEAAKHWPFLNVKRFFDNLTPLQFRIVLTAQNFLPAASVYLKKEVWEKLGGYDESIPLLEDWPFWVKTLANGYKFDFLDKETVAYRFSDTSISQGIAPLSEKYHESNRKACTYAQKSLKDIGILYYIFYYTMGLLIFRIPGIKFFVFFINRLNPAFYRYQNTLILFKSLCKSGV